VDLDLPLDLLDCVCQLIENWKGSFDLSFQNFQDQCFIVLFPVVTVFKLFLLFLEQGDYLTNLFFGKLPSFGRQGIREL
jgi:hypothetical protein